MPRKASRSVTLIDEDDAQSQYPNSDDRELEAYAKAVAEFKVTWQKQKKEKERKFLKAARAELQEHVVRKKGEIKAIMHDMEVTYQDFLSKYAAIEDKQREVIVKIVEAQKVLVALSVRKHQETIEFALEAEESQIGALREIKQTCQDLSGMVDAFMTV